MADAGEVGGPGPDPGKARSEVQRMHDRRWPGRIVVGSRYVDDPEGSIFSWYDCGKSPSAAPAASLLTSPAPTHSIPWTTTLRRQSDAPRARVKALRRSRPDAPIGTLPRPRGALPPGATSKAEIGRLAGLFESRMRFPGRSGQSDRPRAATTPDLDASGEAASERSSLAVRVPGHSYLSLVCKSLGPSYLRKRKDMFMDRELSS